MDAKFAERKEAFDHDAQTLVEVLLGRAQHQPGRRGYTFLLDGEARSPPYVRRAGPPGAAIAARPAEALEAAGDGLCCSTPGLQYAAAFSAAFTRASAAVPSFRRSQRPDPRVRTILADARPRVVLTTSRSFPTPSGCWRRAGVQWRRLRRPRRRCGGRLGVDPGSIAETLAFPQYTAGSTRPPRAHGQPRNPGAHTTMGKWKSNDFVRDST